jgi:hypothetical protein
MSREEKVKQNPESLVKTAAEKIEGLDTILHKKAKIRGRAGKLEAMPSPGANRLGEEEKEAGKRYRARITIRFSSYATMGKFDGYLTDNEKHFRGDYSLRPHPQDTGGTTLRILSIDENNGGPSEQEDNLMRDLRTLGTLIDDYAQQQKRKPTRT